LLVALCLFSTFGCRSASQVEQLEAQAHQYWDRDWSRVIQALDELRRLEPGEGRWREKLYAAYIGDAEAQRRSGNPGGALSRLQQAEALDPSRGVAQERRLAWYPPLPTPVASALASADPCDEVPGLLASCQELASRFGFIEQCDGLSVDECS